MDGIFISYRREESAGYAGRLYDRLAAHFGSDRVFMDVEGIAPGTDFVEAIERAVTSCRVLIVLIGRDWTDMTDGDGRRRLDDPHDFIRLETSTALKRDIRVVPVLLEGARMPRAEELPDELSSLSRRQAIEISHKQWEASTANLIEALDKIYFPDAPTAVTDSIPGGGGSIRLRISHRGLWLGAGLIGLAGLVLLGGWLYLRPAPPPLLTATPPEPAPATSAPIATVPETATPSAVPGTTTAALEPQSAPALEPVPDRSAETVTGRPAVVEPEPEPVPKPEPEPEPEPEPAPRPRILRFTGTVSGASAQLCYDVRDAEQLRLLPRPGRLGNARRDCVTVRIDERTGFRLIAKGGDHSVTDNLVLSPEPAPRPPPTPPLDTPADTPADTRLPSVRDYWAYRVRGRWASTPERTIEVAVLSVTANAVEERLSVIESGTRRTLAQRQVRGPVPYVTRSRDLGTEFSPYLAAFGNLGSDTQWRGIPTPDIDSFWTNWYSRGSVEGRESVTVPAGTFEALKVELWSARNASGSNSERDREPVRVHYRIWYAAEIKRYVKMVRIVTAASGQPINTDTFELLEYRQR